ncbi:OmpP1/FadL family transporter [Candidatus Auribacterota bacterium]
MKRKTLFIVSILLAALFNMVLIYSSEAGGLRFLEQGQPGIGTACVGSAALADDASTAYFNPAGISRLKSPEVLLGSQLTVTNVGFHPDWKNTDPGSNGGDAGGVFPGGGFYYAQNLNEVLGLGLSVNSPIASALGYDNNWKMNYLIQDSFLMVLNINPALSFRITDWMSVGGGVVVNYGYYTQTMALFNPGQDDGKIDLDFDDWAVSYNLGILLEPTKHTRVGVAYRSEVDLKLTGDMDFTNVGGLWTQLGLENTYGESKIAVPRSIMVSVYQDVTDRIALLLDAGWEDWSTMVKTAIVDESGEALELDRDWSDTWRLGLGVHYRASDNLLLKGGFSYDSSPASIRNRLPDLPVDRQWRFAAGFDYNIRKNMKISVSWEFIDLGEAPVDIQPAPMLPRFSGEYDQHANIVSLAFSWKFGKEGKAPGKNATEK